jgi:hypothetical protein
VIEPTGDGTWTALATEASGQHYKKCRNGIDWNACTWLIPVSDPQEFCSSCRLNRTIPNLSVPGRDVLWRKIEVAKRRVVYALQRLNLTIEPKSAQNPQGLCFEILSESENTASIGKRILTGHDNGVITLNLAEADDAYRESVRQQMGEVYRTPLGHVRHEVGHYYWDMLVGNNYEIESVRQVFGDERADYAMALQAHYQRGGAPAGWESQYVTAYASVHPWEDWAETWAHYLHILDTLESACNYGVELRGSDQVRTLVDPYEVDFPTIRDDWHALRFLLNALNRSMGLPDPYPFVLSETISAKFAFIHDWVRRFRPFAS